MYLPFNNRYARIIHIAFVRINLTKITEHIMTGNLQQKPIGLLGGTFDPIHHGHLRLALELYERLDLAEVRLIPSAYPPHRESPAVSAALRLEMVKAAIDGLEGVVADDCELMRPGPSYMVDTLKTIRETHGSRPVYMILGMDAFMNLHTWHRWKELLHYAHILLVRRPGKLLPMTHVMREFLDVNRAKTLDELQISAGGKIYVENIPPLTISATQIRGLLATGRNPRYLLPRPVLNLINSHQLYR